MFDCVEISFLLPCYNVEKYVEECITSIERQGIDSYEILCIDDASADDTVKVIQKIQQKNSRIILEVNECNRGVSFTRNRLLSLAKGKYVWFVDPDDLLVCGSVKKMIEIADRTNSDYVCSNYYEFEDGTLDYKKIEFIEEEIQTGRNTVPPVTNQNGAVAGSVCIGLRRSEWIRKNSLVFNEGVHMTEDVLFNFMCESCERVVTKVEAVSYLYRVRPHSATTARTERDLEKTIRSHIELIRYYRGVECNAEQRQKADTRVRQGYMSLRESITRLNSRKKVAAYLKELRKHQITGKFIPGIASTGGVMRRFISRMLRLDIGVWSMWLLRKMLGKTFK